ncbi:hypothetical protein GTZ99_11240 [Novosphingobium sp. FSY-8]|uniref:Macrocin-O-methyltransferase TylF n=1 Tax=Novosphingobium ovatum TaxID=1908523 RepID=A0ABW9XF20_9SPHN|nr:TylF/MycF/NovP-related O-methyltransferase [Novosphingobium ovatum]NBC37132.1 hypothetical protein [Novosphingobium ovatum]
MGKLVIFGTGSALRDLLGILPQTAQVVALADNNAGLHGQEVLGFPVVAPADLPAMEFDLCVIAARAVDPIRAQLIGLGIAAERIAAYYPSYSDDLARAVGADIARMNDVLGLNLPMPGIATMYLWPHQGAVAQQAGGASDFVRRQAIHLAAETIALRDVPGAIAELGVYQGETAAFLNGLFPDRDLHLFDTFEGFASADVAADTARGFSDAHAGDFQDTDVARVLARMPHPERIALHQGFFPATAQGVEARFAFVSLDVDLYAPTLAGLEWFYERLNPGGYIFVHDYNNRRYMGVRQAVEAFLAKVPAPMLALPDFAGSVVILK